MLFHKSFKGGIHPPEKKHLSKDKSIENMIIPDKVILPVHQHTGTPCKPIVNVGDNVVVGQKIAESEAFVSSPIHASVSGKVTAIELRPHPIFPKAINSIVIETDKEQDCKHIKELFNKKEDWNHFTKEEILNKIKNAGIVGLGGATFPTHVKLSPPPQKTIDAVILNGAECEPYLTNDYRIMIEKPQEIIEGLQIILKILQVNKGFIGIESNKMDVVKLLKKHIFDEKISNIEVVPLRVKYPQGAEKQLIKAILNREVPRGGLPFDVGVIVQNVATARAIYEAVVFNKPLIEKIITVSGEGIKEPKNLLVRIGTALSDIIKYCGGEKGEISKIIMGGPMMGFAQWTLDVPVIKGTSGILLFPKKREKETTNCIRCGRCVNVCPMKLTPNQLADFSQKDNFDACKNIGVMDCMECGACAFICSAKIPIVHYIKYAKMQLLKKK